MVREFAGERRRKGMECGQDNWLQAVPTLVLDCIDVPANLGDLELNKLEC